MCLPSPIDQAAASCSFWPRVTEGDKLALLSAGAYGFVMAGTYNTRPMPAEVLVKGRQAALVRKRQKVKDIWKGEATAPWQK